MHAACEQIYQQLDHACNIDDSVRSMETRPDTEAKVMGCVVAGYDVAESNADISFIVVALFGQTAETGPKSEASRGLLSGLQRN